MKNKNVLLLTLSALIFANSLSASRLNMGDDDSRFETRTTQKLITGAPQKLAITASSDESYWSWGTSFFQKNKAKVVAGLVIGTSIACAAYSYFSGTDDESTSSSMPIQQGFTHDYSAYDRDNLTVNVSVLNHVSGVIVDGVCSLIKSYTTDGHVSFETDCSDFYGQNPSFFNNK